MDIITALWFFPLLFMVHNFEEIIMIQPWWRRNQAHPLQSPFTKLAAYPSETVATLIGGIFVLFSLVTVLAITSHHLIFGIGLALAFGLQLVGHIVEFVRLRRYMPYIVTAVFTLPYYPWLFIKALQAGYSLSSLALGAMGMGALGLIVLWLSHAASGRISRWLGARPQ